ncbi:MAG: hypothetical protein LBN20_06095 [Endomicrobium sp.]|jgi:hypothetical protein|nr:hypothetical protein [Endomicrobium sp.]
MSKTQEWCIMFISESLISSIMSDAKLNRLPAMDAFYKSNTFKKLSDIKTGLYTESPAYVYDMYKEEIQN